MLVVGSNSVDPKPAAAAAAAPGNLLAPYQLQLNS